MHSPQEAAAKLRSVAKSQQKNALLLVNRHGTSQFVGLSVTPGVGSGTPR